ncbi:MAG: hypothetical protein K2M45_08120 [Muribaculaceae bacterium]|nr:hypothetical protein [Muribaculaceae bacterium]
MEESKQKLLDSITNELTKLYSMKEKGDRAALEAYARECIAKSYAISFFKSEANRSVFEQEVEFFIKILRGLASVIKIKTVIKVPRDDNEKSI